MDGEMTAIGKLIRRKGARAVMQEYTDYLDACAKTGMAKDKILGAREWAEAVNEIEEFDDPQLGSEANESAHKASA